MTWDSTKLNWTGDDIILLTRREDRESIILTSYEVRMLIKEWAGQNDKK